MTEGLTKKWHFIENLKEEKEQVCPFIFKNFISEGMCQIASFYPLPLVPAPRSTLHPPCFFLPWRIVCGAHQQATLQFGLQLGSADWELWHEIRQEREWGRGNYSLRLSPSGALNNMRHSRTIISPVLGCKMWSIKDVMTWSWHNWDGVIGVRMETHSKYLTFCLLILAYGEVVFLFTEPWKHWWHLLTL